MGDEHGDVTIRVPRRYLSEVETGLRIVGFDLTDNTSDDIDYRAIRVVTEEMRKASANRFASGTGFRRLPDAVGAKEILDAYFGAEADAEDKLRSDVERKGANGPGRIHTSITVLMSREVKPAQQGDE